jgi:hypothetical protein
MREALCSNIDSTLDIQDVSSDVILSRANYISAILIDPSQISSTALESCAHALLSTLSDYPELAAVDGTVDAVINALSALLSVGTALPSDIQNTISATVTDLSVGRQSSLVQNEASSSFVSSSFTMLTTKQSESSISTGQTYSMPQSSFEAFSNARVPSLTIKNSRIGRKLNDAVNSQDDRRLVDGGADGIGITFLQVKKNIGAMKTNSSVVQVQMDYYGGAPGNTATSFTIVLLNKKVMQYFYYPPVITNITCSPMKNSYKVSAECATDPSLEVDCPGDYRYGYVQFTCPSIKKAPVCTTYSSNSDTFEPTNNCQVIEYTSENTTCSCQQIAGTTTGVHRRRLSVQTIQQFASSFKTTVTPSAGTYIDLGAYSVIEAVYDTNVQFAFAGMGIILLLGAIMYVLLDVRKANVEFKLKEEEEKYKESNKATNPDPPRSIRDFYANLLPPEFDVTEWNIRLWKQLFIDHEVLFLLTNGDARGSNDTENGDDDEPKAKPITNDTNSNAREKELRIEKWVVLMSRFATYFLINTLVILTFYADDGTCQMNTNQEDCLSSLAFTDYSCLWSEENRSCYYNDILQRPTSLLALIQIVTIVAVIGAPIEKLLRYMIAQNKIFYTENHPWCDFGYARRRAIQALDRSLNPTYRNSASGKVYVDFGEGKDTLFDDPNDPIVNRPGLESSPMSSPSSKGNTKSAANEVGYELGDELKDVQIRSTTIIHGARLLRMQETMDYVQPDVELKLLLEYAKKCPWLPKEQKRVTKKNTLFVAIDRLYSTIKWHIDEVGDPLQASRLMYYAGTQGKSLIIAKLSQGRRSAEAIKVHLNTISNDKIKETYLMKKFIVNSLPGLRHKVAHHYFFGIDELKFTLRRQVVLRYLSVIALPVYILGVIFYGYQSTANKIGSLGASLWLVVLALAIVYDVFILQMIKILMKWVIIVDTTRPTVRDLHATLQYRSRSLIRRKTGLMKNLSSLVQHFNPACRAARSFPHLPVSRLLMSLNDFDLPVLNNFSSTGYSANITPLASTTSPLLSDHLDVFIHNSAILSYEFANNTMKYMISFFTVSLYLIVALPDYVQDAVMEVVITLTMCLLLVIYYFSYQASPVLLLVLVLLLLVLMLFGAYYRYRLFDRYRRGFPVFPEVEPWDYMDKDPKLNEIRGKLQHHLDIYKRPLPHTDKKYRPKQKYVHTVKVAQMNHSRSRKIVPIDVDIDDESKDSDSVMSYYSKGTKMSGSNEFLGSLSSPVNQVIKMKPGLLTQSLNTLSSTSPVNSLKLKPSNGATSGRSIASSSIKPIVGAPIISQGQQHRMIKETKSLQDALDIPYISNLGFSSISGTSDSDNNSKQAKAFRPRVLPALKTEKTDDESVTHLSDIEEDLKMSDVKSHKHHHREHSRDSDRDHRRDKHRDSRKKHGRHRSHRSHRESDDSREQDDEVNAHESADVYPLEAGRNSKLRKRRNNRHRSGRHSSKRANEDSDDAYSSNMEIDGPGSVIIRDNGTLGDDIKVMAQRGEQWAPLAEDHQDLSVSKYLGVTPLAIAKELQKPSLLNAAIDSKTPTATSPVGKIPPQFTSQRQLRLRLTPSKFNSNMGVSSSAGLFAPINVDDNGSMVQTSPGKDSVSGIDAPSTVILDTTLPSGNINNIVAHNRRIINSQLAGKELLPPPGINSPRAQQKRVPGENINEEKFAPGRFPMWD